MVKMSNRMRNALNSMASGVVLIYDYTGGIYNPYPVKLNTPTMDIVSLKTFGALRDRGYIKAARSTKITTEWEITDAGREALAHADTRGYALR